MPRYCRSVQVDGVTFVMIDVTASDARVAVVVAGMLVAIAGVVEVRVIEVQTP
jgi:hypothetical protein